MKNVIYTSILILALVVGPSNSLADTLYPVADMYTDPNHGGGHPASEIWVANFSPASNYQRLMMKFDLDNYMGHTVDEAFLNFYRFFGCPSGGVTGTIMYNITVDWADETWPENVHIDHGDIEYGHYNFSVNGWHQIDITDIVQAWLNGDISNHGFVLVATPGSKFSKFYSREASESLCPYLDLTTITAIDDDQEPLPDAFSMNAYPNPFNAAATIEYSLPSASEVTVEIFNVLGQTVATPVCEYLQPGSHKMVWHGDGNPTGVYFVKINAEDFSQTCKLMLLK